MKTLFTTLGLLLAVAVTGTLPAAETSTPCCGQQPIGVQVKKYQRGRKVNPEVTKRLHAGALLRHGDKIAKLPVATQASFDCRTAFNNVLPTNDQGQCGDCFGVSSADVCSMALVKAGTLPLDGFTGRLSSQYGLDSGAFQGGCNGGDEAQVIDYIKQNGFPLTSAYGPYTGGPQRAKPTAGMAIFKISDWGYAKSDQGQGIASTDEMKAAMLQYGPLSVAFDASECDNYQWPGTMTGNGTNIDHAVICIGWDDNHDNGDGTKGAFLGMNQWGGGQGAIANPTWEDGSLWNDNWPSGPNGTFWIKYGADSWGTEAIWVTGAVSPGGTPTLTATPATGAAPLKVTFTTNATGAYMVDFGDGTPLVVTLVPHTYMAVGNYTVTLTSGTQKATATVVVTTIPPPPPTPAPWCGPIRRFFGLCPTGSRWHLFGRPHVR